MPDTLSKALAALLERVRQLADDAACLNNPLLDSLLSRAREELEQHRKAAVSNIEPRPAALDKHP